MPWYHHDLSDSRDNAVGEADVMMQNRLYRVPAEKRGKMLYPSGYARMANSQFLILFHGGNNAHIQLFVSIRCFSFRFCLGAPGAGGCVSLCVGRRASQLPADSLQ